MIPGVSGDLLSSAAVARHVRDHDAAPDPGFGAWARQVVRWQRQCERALGPASAPRAMLDLGGRPLAELLGYTLARVEPQPWGHAAVLAAEDVPAATWLSTTWARPAADVWRHALNASLVARLPWALIFNGTTLTIVDATRPWARRGLAFDLETVCRHPGALQAVWLLARAAAVGTPQASTLAEAAAASEADGLKVRRDLSDGVLDALGALVSGVDPRPRAGRRQAPDDAATLEQALTVVYRLLFLFFAEARHLVPVWHHIYRDAYSMDALCRRVMTRSAARGVWATVQALSRVAHLGCDAGDLRVTAFNGRLFAPGRTPLAENPRVPDRVAAQAILALGTTPTRQGRQRIAFHDLGVEQLGAVYERVLEYEPARQGPALTLRPTSADRKTSGSFYTPRAMTDFLVRRTLGPLVEGRSSSAILSLRIIDPAMGSGAFLVSACRYLTERTAQALVAEGQWTEGDAREADRAELARTVVERCLYGIDRNPTAVQLSRLSLWLTTLAADRPLTFLDHHLAVGNSLVGARLVDLAHSPRDRGPARPSSDAQLTLFDEQAMADFARTVVPERLRLERNPSLTPESVREKERRFDRLRETGGTLARWIAAADLWCGLVLDRSHATSPGLYDELQRHLAGCPTTLAAHQLAAPAERAIALARAYGACHWELLFPEVFLDERGTPLPGAGFDAVIGNPPWEMMRADTGDAANRTRTRDDQAAVLRYLRRSGQYPLQGPGHLNCYQPFVERALHALRPGGRFGLILPSGLQTDVGSADLRRRLLDTCQLDTWLAFENRKAIFPIHRGVRFILLAGAAGGRTDTLPIACGLSDVALLTELPDDPRHDEGARPTIRLTRSFLERWDPLGLAIPAMASPLDARVCWRAMAHPALAAHDGWRIRFGRELNATDDAAHFVALDPAERDGRAGAVLPVIDGRHVRPFAIARDRVERGIAADAAARLLDRASSFGRARVCYRDVASASNRWTLIAALLPPGVVSTHTVFCAKQPLRSVEAWCLVGLLNSLVANYLVRLQMSTHVTAALMARLPVPRPAPGSSDRRTLAALARVLSRAETVEDAPDLYARLNAIAARLYGLSRDEYAHVVSTFPLLPEAIRAACLHAYGHRSPTAPRPTR